MRAVLCGANGAMGKLIDGILGNEIVGRVSLDGGNGVAKTFGELPPEQTDCDLVIDFSHHSAIFDVVDFAVAHGCALVVGTTGHDGGEKTRIYEAAREIPVFYSGNMSMGIAVLCRLAKEAAACFPEADIEILEAHHNRKVDAPSGTAHMIFRAIREVRPQAVACCGRAGEGRRKPEEIGVASLRLGGVVGTHEVRIATDSQVLTLRHEALSRDMLAEGAVAAARFVAGKAPGLYTMEELLKER